MKCIERGGASATLGEADIASFLDEVLDALAAEKGRPGRVLIVPPDQTRLHSRAGDLTCGLVQRLGPAVKAIVPATGTHVAMSAAELAGMFPGVDPSLFRRHDHRNGVKRLGEIEASFIEGLSGGRLSFPYPGDFASSLVDEEWDLVLSVGQVVPHEVVGMANFTKNLVVGLGGSSSIDHSHWLGAVCGMEGIMGRADSPVRRLFDESARRFLAKVPTVYLLTVLSRDQCGRLALRGLFAGPGPGQAGGAEESLAYRKAAALAAEVNIESVKEPFRTCVVRLDPAEFRSTWLGNKAIYRTRMAMADAGELFILAPGVERFGEDGMVDRLIRRHGYRGTAKVLDGVGRDPELAANLSAAAHLVHGSSEGRFHVTYCTERISRGEIEGVGYSWMALREAEARFGSADAKDGWNRGPDGTDYFFISNPAVGLWKVAER
jgi:nickel-dependent lactate racemase